MRRSDAFLIAGIGAITFVALRSWQRLAQQRRQRDREAGEARARWEGEGGAPAGGTAEQTVSPTA